MNQRNRQRIAYVLPQDHTRVGHRLGINSLAFDEDHNVLFSAGRDGLIYGWESKSDGKAQWTSCRAHVQAHMHWINAISLVDGNKALVSASSDVSVKVFRPYKESPCKPTTIGVHNDYVKALASPGSACSWVAAGGLDYKIRLWDLEGRGSRLDIDNSDENSPEKGSVYTLCANDSLILSGGPDNTVKLWDARVKRQATKFVGHTDNVRSILVSKDKTLVASASSDRTVKLWSLVAGRCLTTFTMHNDSVWSLASTHPRLSVFYSGDKGGLVAKTDISSSTEPQDGISVAICFEKEGVHDIVATDHDIWTATSLSSINRWENVDLSGGITFPESSKGFRWSDSSRARTTQHQRTHRNNSGEKSSGTISRESTIPLRSALKLSHASNFTSFLQRDFDRQYGSVSASTRKTSRSSVELGTFHPLRDHPTETIQGHAGLIKHVLLNDKRRVLTMDTAGDLVLWDLVMCKGVKFLGRGDIDKIASGINTVEQVPPWCTVDTRTGFLTCILEEASCFDAEVYADELTQPLPVIFREDQRINLGKWILRLLFSRLIDEEIIRDQTFRGEQKENRHDENRPLEEENSSAVGENAPRNEFDVLASVDHTGGSPQVPSHSPIMTGVNLASSPLITPLDSEHTKKTQGISATEDILQATREDYFALQPNTLQDNNHVDPHVTAKPPSTLISTLEPGHLGPKQDGEKKESNKEPTSPLARKLWIQFGQRKSTRQITETNEQTDQEHEAQEQEEIRADAVVNPYDDRLLGTIRDIRKEYSQRPRRPHVTTQCLLNPPPLNEAPLIDLPDSVAVIIQEQRADAAVAVDLFEGKLSTLNEHADILETVIPRWVGDALLRNRVARKEPEKVSFILEPLQALLPPISGGSENDKLTANRMLRVRKILTYVAERLQKMDPLPDGVPVLLEESPAVPKPEDWLELICETQMVPPTSTLNTIRTHVSKSASDIVLFYRLSKKRGSGA